MENKKIQYKIPKRLIKTKYRKEMWENAQKMVKQIEKVLPVESAHVLGSFTTKKSRPADVDFILLLNTKESNKKAKWSLDLVIAPDNAYGKFVLEDADEWVKEKYDGEDEYFPPIKKSKYPEEN